MIRSSPSNSLVAYATKGKLPVFAVPASKQAYLYNIRAANNSGGAITVGLCRRYSNAGFNVFQYTAVGPVYADISAALAAGTATNIFSTTNNDGFVVSGPTKFSMIGFTISSASTGGTYSYQYWNGSSYTTLTTLEVPSYGSTGDIWIAFQPPVDWAVGGEAGSLVPANAYSIRVRGTTHPTTAVAVTAIWVAEFLELYEGVPNNAMVQMSFPDSKPYLLNGGESFIPYFSGTAAANQCGCYYSLV